MNRKQWEQTERSGAAKYGRPMRAETARKTCPECQRREAVDGGRCWQCRGESMVER